MKKLLVLTIFLSSMVIPSVANAKWTKIAKNLEGNTYYVDLERIKKHSGKVYFWNLTDYLKPTKYGVLSSKIYNEAECGRFRLRVLSATYYKGPMGTGTVIVSGNNPNKEWDYPSPNSVIESVLTTVCNHKSMQ